MSDVVKKILWSLVLSIPAAILSFVIHEVLHAWGIFSPFAEWLGGWLKMHVSVAQAEWTIAGIIASVAYAALLWAVWRHHRIPQIVGSVPSGLPVVDVEKADTATRIPLLDLLHEAEASGWSLQNRDISQRFAQGLRQAGAERAVEIWGRDLKKGWDLKSAPFIYTSERIPPTYFKDHWIEVQQALTHQLNAYTRTSRPAGSDPRFFADLYVDRLLALEWLRSKGILLRDTLKD